MQAHPRRCNRRKKCNPCSTRGNNNNGWDLRIWRRGWDTPLAALRIVPCFQQHALNSHKYWRFVRFTSFQLSLLFHSFGSNFGLKQTPKTPRRPSFIMPLLVEQNTNDPSELKGNSNIRPNRVESDRRGSEARQILHTTSMRDCFVPEYLRVRTICPLVHFYGRFRCVVLPSKLDSQGLVF